MLFIKVTNTCYPSPERSEQEEWSRLGYCVRPRLTMCVCVFKKPYFYSLLVFGEAFPRITKVSYNFRLNKSQVLKRQLELIWQYI